MMCLCKTKRNWVKKLGLVSWYVKNEQNQNSALIFSNFVPLSKLFSIFCQFFNISGRTYKYFSQRVDEGLRDEGLKFSTQGEGFPFPLVPMYAFNSLSTYPTELLLFICLVTCLILTLLFFSFEAFFQRKQKGFFSH